MKRIAILGATGSIGSQAIDVIRKHSELFKLAGISLNKNSQKAIEIIDEFKPELIAVSDHDAYLSVKEYCSNNNLKNVEVITGENCNCDVAVMDDADMVLTSVTGLVGLKPTIAAIDAGKDIALANKETLVSAGSLVINEANKKNVKILPVDSEHGAIFQCIQGNDKKSIKNLLITASGGPFRGKSINDLKNVSPEDALKHPKWNMGKKITIDSSTLMNKGLEVIEAHFLFGIPYSNIKVIVHPQSIIHSMVEYIDGSVIGQMASTDMRLPIEYAFSYPERIQRVVEELDFYKLKELTFEKPDFNTFKCLKLAYDAGKIGGLMPSILNSANEEAVMLFLDRRISFLSIADIVENCMLKFDYNVSVTIENIIQNDINIKKYIDQNY